MKAVSKGASHKVTMSTPLSVIAPGYWGQGETGSERKDALEQLHTQSLGSEATEWRAAVRTREKAQGLCLLMQDEEDEKEARGS